MPRRKTDNDGYDVRGQGKRAPRTKGTWNAEFGGWVNYDIPVEQRAQFEAWATGEAVWAESERLAVTGVKVTLGWSDYDGCYMASVFDRNEASPNAGLMHSQRSDTSWRAFAKLMFVTATILGSDWSKFAARPRTENW